MTPDSAWPFGDLRPASYSVVLADPPWHFRTYSKRGEKKSPQAKYATMSPEAIKELPVGRLALPDCVLVLWATSPFMPQALATMTAWGFAFKSMGAWAKRSSTGQKWAFGTGYCYRSAAEFWLLGTVGHPKQRVRDVRNLIVAPIREHSRKPDEMRVNCERLWAGPYAELFARERAPGWDAWGLEADRFGG